MLPSRYPNENPNTNPDAKPDAGAAEAVVESSPRPQGDMTKPAAAPRTEAPSHGDYDLYPLGLHEFDHYVVRAIANRRFHVH